MKDRTQINTEKTDSRRLNIYNSKKLIRVHQLNQCSSASNQTAQKDRTQINAEKTDSRGMNIYNKNIFQLLSAQSAFICVE